MDSPTAAPPRPRGVLPPNAVDRLEETTKRIEVMSAAADGESFEKALRAADQESRAITHALWGLQNRRQGARLRHRQAQKLRSLKNLVESSRGPAALYAPSENYEDALDAETAAYLRDNFEKTYLTVAECSIRIYVDPTAGAGPGGGGDGNSSEDFDRDYDIEYGQLADEIPAEAQRHQFALFPAEDWDGVLADDSRDLYLRAGTRTDVGGDGKGFFTPVRLLQKTAARAAHCAGTCVAAGAAAGAASAVGTSMSPGAVMISMTGC